MPADRPKSSPATAFHPPRFYEKTPGVPGTADLEAESLEVGNDVWIGSQAVVTPGCNRVGQGAVIGAGAVVTKDVPDFAIMGGNPAKVLRYRFPVDKQKLIKMSEWWKLDGRQAKWLGRSVTKGAGSAVEQKRCIASVVIPAHNEESVIGRCLAGLLQDALPGELEIIVVANGCQDGTAKIARGFGDSVQVLETAVASKITALNLGDRTASCYPRVYLDADVSISIHAIRELCELLDSPSILAASPRIAWDLSNSNFWVRCFYRIWRHQPYFENGRLGSGVYALNEKDMDDLGVFRMLLPMTSMFADCLNRTSEQQQLPNHLLSQRQGHFKI